MKLFFEKNEIKNKTKNKIIKIKVIIKNNVKINLTLNFFLIFASKALPPSNGKMGKRLNSPKEIFAETNKNVSSYICGKIHQIAINIIAITRFIIGDKMAIITSCLSIWLLLLL